MGGSIENYSGNGQSHEYTDFLLPSEYLSKNVIDLNTHIKKIGFVL